jgi:hypothetical protein
MKKDPGAVGRCRTRPRTVPPVVTRRPEGALRGRDILLEYPGPLGTTLWLLWRDVELWSSTPPERRGSLFNLAALRAWSASQLPHSLALPLHSIMDVLSSTNGDRAAEAATACSRVAEWSVPRGRLTAVLFAEAAAQLEPASAALARDVGRYAIPCSATTAKSWLGRASALARGSKDWVTLAHATTDLAALYESLGDRRNARAALLRARRLRLKFQLKGEVRARTETAMLSLILTLGAAQADVEVQIRRVLRTYPLDAPEATALRITVVEMLIDADRTHEALRAASLYPSDTPEGNDRLAELKRKAAEAHGRRGGIEPLE